MVGYVFLLISQRSRVGGVCCVAVCGEIAWFVWFVMSLNFYILRMSSCAFMSFVMNVNILIVRDL